MQPHPSTPAPLQGRLAARLLQANASVAFNPKAFANQGFYASIQELCQAIEGQPGARLPGARRKATVPKPRLRAFKVPAALMDTLQALV